MQYYAASLTVKTVHCVIMLMIISSIKREKRGSM
jgi:hypothetical protein